MSLFATPPMPSHARTRSLRAPPAKAALTAPLSTQQSTATARSVATGSGGSSVQDTTSSHGTTTTIPSSTSNLTLFLTNLRLLDLDLEPDWPDITPATFSPREASGGQKKRIQAVEWVLYQLFASWDPNEARDKLRPFFPPIDQVQSVNLRAALTRCLEQLKRNGFLGRDAVVRKTMLDECKGDRLEEVLAAFSSAVLKKLVAERSLNSDGADSRPSISEQIAVENRGYTGERTELNGLLIAHKVVLTKMLAEKNEERARYRDFEDLLELKQSGLARRRELVQVSSAKEEASDIGDETRAEARDILRTNWTGNESWVDALLYSGAETQPTTLLDAPFDDVWSGVQQGRLSDLETEGSDLLGQLDDRVQAQRARLGKWETFHEKMFGAQKAAPVTPKRKQERPKRIIEFRSHKNAHLSTKSRRPADDTRNEEVPAEYDQIMADMEHELGRVGQAKIPNFAKMFGSTAARLGAAAALMPEPMVSEPISDLSDWEDEPELPPPKRAVETERSTEPNRATRPETSPRRKPSLRSIPRRQDSRQLGKLRKASVVEDDEPFVALHPPTPDESAGEASSYTHNKRRSPERPMTPEQAVNNETSQEEQSPLEPEITMPASPSPPASPTRLAADDILAYVSAASPSPLKKSRHMLSLAERTRMSMSRGQSFEAEESNRGRLSPAKSEYTIIVEEPGDVEKEKDADGGATIREDLIARTRRSMAGFEAARQKAQLERRRSLRRTKTSPRKDGNAYFPRVDEDGEGGCAGDTSIVDELLSVETGGGEVDYEAVFRSRPKIKMSPAASPLRKWDEE